MASTTDNDEPAPSVGQIYSHNENHSSYKILAQLGRGHFSSVWLAEHAYGDAQQVIAIKIPKATAKTNSDFEYQLACEEVESLRHSSNPQDNDLFEKLLLPSSTLRIDSFACTALIFNDLCGPSVYEYAIGSPGGRLPFTMAQRAIADLMDAVAFLHSQSIGHGDIHTGNLLMVSSPPTRDYDILSYTATRQRLMHVPFDDLAPADVQPMMTFLAENNITFTCAIKLADFGGAFHANDGGTAKCRLEVKAPERLEGKTFSLPADVWALACTIVEVVTGKPLFPGPECLPWQEWTDVTFLDVVGASLGGSGSGLMKSKLEDVLQNYDARHIVGEEIDAAQLLDAMLRKEPEDRVDTHWVKSRIQTTR